MRKRWRTVRRRVNTNISMLVESTNKHDIALQERKKSRELEKPNAYFKTEKAVLGWRHDGGSQERNESEASEANDRMRKFPREMGQAIHQAKTRTGVQEPSGEKRRRFCHKRNRLLKNRRTSFRYG